MSSNLTLKQRIELFKISKKPRKQIRLKCDALTLDLNLPSLSDSTHAKFTNFKLNKKMFSNHYDNCSFVKPKYKTENSFNGQEQILRLKNQLNRQKLIKECLKNRKEAAETLKQIIDANNHWIAYGNQHFV